MDMEHRYSRHHLLAEIGKEGQERLHRASVLIVGVGGLGSPLALYLTAACVGRIGLMDDDVVSITNLQRQILYNEGQVGASKVACAQETLSHLNSETVIETHPYRLTDANAMEIISRYDVVLDGCDNHATRYVLDACCEKLHKPYVYGSIGEFNGQVSVFHYGRGFRYADLYPDRIDLESKPQRVSGVMGVVPGIIGSIEAAEAIKIITGAGQTLDGRLLVMDALSMNFQILEIG